MLRTAALLAASIAALSSAQAAYPATTAENMALFSSAVWCQNPSLQAWNCNRCQQLQGAGVVVEPSSVQVFLNETTGLKAMTAYIPSSGVAVVVFRGSADTANWLEDFFFFQQNFTTDYSHVCSGCKIHRGFYDSYLDLAPLISSALIRYGGTKNKVWVTGQSLGAALATITALELELAGYNVQQLYTFGSPRIGNPAWAEFFTATMGSGPALAAKDQALHAARLHVAKTAHTAALSPLLKQAVAVSQKSLRVSVGPSTVYRVTHFHDPVPHLPFPNTFGELFQHVPTEVWYNEDNTAWTVCSSTNGEDPSCSNSVTLPLGFGDHDFYAGVKISGCIPRYNATD